jgi:F-type H+-transporting ATPase subunit epsilon
MPLSLEIVTPEARVYSDTIDTVVIPTTSGEIGILPGHIPLLTQVAAGALRVTKGTVTTLLAVSGGFAQIAGDKVSVLAQSAIEAEKIDEQAAENAMKRAEEELLKGTSSLPPAEIERLEGVVRFSVAQLGVKRRR